MANTYTPKREFLTGGGKTWVGTITFDSSYPTGGEVIDLTQLGMFQVFSVVASPTSGYWFDWNGSATSPKLLAYMPGIMSSVSKTFGVADMTDSGTTGTIDYASNALPIGAVPVSATLACSGAFAGDTSAVWKLGIAGDLDRYSVVTTNSCFTAITTSSLVKNATAVQGTDAARTPRLTITSAADFTSVVTDAGGAAVSTLYYLPGGSGAEVASTTNLATVTADVVIHGI